MVACVNGVFQFGCVVNDITMADGMADLLFVYAMHRNWRYFDRSRTIMR